MYIAAVNHVSIPHSEPRDPMRLLLRLKVSHAVIPEKIVFNPLHEHLHRHAGQVRERREPQIHSICDLPAAGTVVREGGSDGLFEGHGFS